MKKLCTALSAVLVVSGLWAARGPGFGMRALRAVISDGGTVVISPFAFELDCALMSEAFDSIVKAKYVETLGALTGYDTVYQPISETYAKLAETNDFELLSARVFLAPSTRLFKPQYRQQLLSLYNAAVAGGSRGRSGAERWLRASMEGRMRNLDIPETFVAVKDISFLDCEAFRIAWEEPFPTKNTRKGIFTGADGTRREVEFMTDLRVVEQWRNQRFTFVRLPMAAGSWFYAALPSGETPLDSLFGDFTPDRIAYTLTVVKSLTESGVSRGPTAIAVPKLDLVSETDLAPAFLRFALPIGGFKEIESREPLAGIRQRCRLQIDEHGVDGYLAEKPVGDQVRADAETGKFLLNRPFLFFVYHEGTATMPVAGVYR